MLTTDVLCNVNSRANSIYEYQVDTEHDERERCLLLKDPVHNIPFHTFLKSQVMKIKLN